MATAFPPVPSGDIWGQRLIDAIVSRDEDVADEAEADRVVMQNGEASRVAAMLADNASATTAPFEARAKKVALAEMAKVKRSFEAIYYIPGVITRHFGWNPIMENLPYKITGAEVTMGVQSIGGGVIMKLLIDHVEMYTFAISGRFTRLDFSSFPFMVNSQQQVTFEVAGVGTIVPGADMSIRLLGEYL